MRPRFQEARAQGLLHQEGLEDCSRLRPTGTPARCCSRGLDIRTLQLRTALVAKGCCVICSTPLFIRSTPERFPEPGTFHFSIFLCPSPRGSYRTLNLSCEELQGCCPGKARVTVASSAHRCMYARPSGFPAPHGLPSQAKVPASGFIPARVSVSQLS